MGKIAIIGALDEEILYYLKELKEPKKHNIGRFYFYSGKLDGKDIVIVKSGAGKVNAAVCAQIVIGRFNPTVVIFTGVAGALDPSLEIGDIIISKDSLHHDMDATKLGFKLGQIPFSDFYLFDADEKLLELAMSTTKDLGLKARPGRLLSGDIFVTDTNMTKKLRQSFQGDCIDMESAAVAQTCVLNEIPHITIRSISDRADHSAAVEFPKFCKKAAKNSFTLVRAMIAKMKNEDTDIKSKIRTIPHWPKKGIMFRDITTLLKDRMGFGQMILTLRERYENAKIDVIVGIESRGFIIGAALASQLGIGFVPIRKKGKLPSKTINQEYTLEYGTDMIEIHIDAIDAGSRVLLVDDLIATGGTAMAACKLIKKLKCEIVECVFVIDLPELGGRKKLETNGYKVFSLVEFEGE